MQSPARWPGQNSLLILREKVHAAQARLAPSDPAVSRFDRFSGLGRFHALFGREPILESVTRARRAPRPPKALSQRLTERALCPPEDLFAQLGTSEQGLGDSEARARLQEHGPNDVEQDHPPAWWHHLWVSYRNPFNLLLDRKSTRLNSSHVA